MFVEHEGDGFPLEVSLSNMALAISNHIQQRGHPMPFEYVIKIVASVIPRLSHAILVQLPLHRWSRWFQEPQWFADQWLTILGPWTGCRLEELGQLLVRDIKAQDGIWYLDVTNLPDPEDQEGKLSKQNGGNGQYATESYPSASNAWTVTLQVADTTWTAYAVCAK